MDKEAIRKKLSKHKPLRVNDERFKRSAVLMPLFMKNGEWHVLFTLRSANLPTHKSQISFPGGGLEEGEKALDAALRESKEEMGIESEDVDVLGRLDEITTITKYRITPFVGVIPYPYNFTVNTAEIAEVIELPLEMFLNPKVFRKDESWTFNDSRYAVYFFDVAGYTIWGATAKILKQFLEVAMDWVEPGGAPHHH